MDDKELKKDLINVKIKIVFNPKDSQQVELMEAIQKIFNKLKV